MQPRFLEDLLSTDDAPYMNLFFNNFCFGTAYLYINITLCCEPAIACAKENNKKFEVVGCVKVH